MNITILAMVTLLNGCSEQSHSRVVSTEKVSGYPVYKFLNFSGIDQHQLESNEEAAKELLGYAYDEYVEHHQRMVAAGFDLHKPLRILPDDADEVLVYIQNSDYDQLWAVSPHDLSAQGKSHLVSIEYEQIQVGDEVVNRASSIRAELVDREPILVK